MLKDRKMCRQVFSFIMLKTKERKKEKKVTKLINTKIFIYFHTRIQRMFFYTRFTDVTY